MPGCAARKKMPTWRPSTGNVRNAVKLSEISASGTVITRDYWCFREAGVLTQWYRVDGRCVRHVNITIHHAVSFQTTSDVISRSAVLTVYLLVQIYIDSLTIITFSYQISAGRQGHRGPTAWRAKITRGRKAPKWSESDPTKTNYSLTFCHLILKIKQNNSE